MAAAKTQPVPAEGMSLEEAMSKMDVLQAKYWRLRDAEDPKAEAAFEELMTFKIENGLVEEVDVSMDGLDAEDFEPTPDTETPEEDKAEETPADNVFCSTGKGGGVDPSCSPGDNVVVAHEKRKNDYHKFTVQIDGEDAGYLTVKAWPGLKEVNVKQIEVSENFRRRGLATKLHEAAYQFAKSQGMVYKSDASQMRTAAAEGYWKKMVAQGLATFDDGIYVRNEATWHYDDITGNVFCSTGKGGGVDPSCSTGGGTGGAGGGRKGSIDNLLDRIHAPDGGFTYSPTSGSPTTGFALSPYPERSFAKSSKTLKLVDIVDYVYKNRDLLAKPEHYVGGWNDPATGKVYLDVSVVTQDRKRAATLAREKDQIAYFDLSAGKSVTVNPNATSGGVATNRFGVGVRNGGEAGTDSGTGRPDAGDDRGTVREAGGAKAHTRGTDGGAGASQNPSEDSEMTPEQIKAIGEVALNAFRAGAAVAADPTDNAFCATGKGGGVDPSCSPGGGKPPTPATEAAEATKAAAAASKRAGGPGAVSAQQVLSNLENVYKAGKKVSRTGHERLAAAHDSIARTHYAARDRFSNTATVDSDFPGGDSPYALQEAAGYAHQNAADAHRRAAGMIRNEDGGDDFREVLTNFNPGQPRDREGKWTTGGAGSAPTTEGTGHTVLKPHVTLAAGGTHHDPQVPPPPGKAYKPDVEEKGTHGVTKAARVGVPAEVIPPPPPIGKLPNLTSHEREVENKFIDSYNSNPDGMARKFLDIVNKSTKPGEPLTFGTDDAKALTDAWSHPDLTLEQRAQNRATLNLPLHQTANAIAKRAFVQHLDTLAPGDEVMVTVGGCGAGKGYALKNVPQALEVKNQAKVVWDSAGDQNATENPWIQAEAERRGLKVSYVYVHADPYSQWAHPEMGVVKRAGDPNDGRMVDAKVFADSYALGAKNHQAFYERNKDNPNAKFIFLANKGKPVAIPGVPEEALALDRKQLAAFAIDAVNKSDAPAHVKRGATMGTRIWGED